MVKQSQGIFQSCVPSTLTQSMQECEPITNVLETQIKRLIHLRDDVFLIGYRVGKIELRDLSKAKPSGEEPDEPLASFDFRDMNDEALANIRDLDCKNRDES